MIATTLTIVAEGIVSALVDKATGTAITKLRSEPAQVAMQESFSKAVEKYAGQGSFQAQIAASLFKKDSLLRRDVVLDEFSKLLLFNLKDKPDYKKLGKLWEDLLDDQATIAYQAEKNRYDLAGEAQRLAEAFIEELRITEEFRPAFDQHKLELIAASQDDIAANTSESADRLKEAVLLLQDLLNFWNSAFLELQNKFAQATPHVRDSIHPFGKYIFDRAKDFTGRQWVFDQVDSFIEQERCGYIRITAEPGMGKSAIAAELVRRRQYLHHFNSLPYGFTKEEFFRQNVCSQIVAKLDLDIRLPAEQSNFTPDVFDKVLDRASSVLRRAGERLIIVVDALDEAKREPFRKPLSLPPMPHENVYFIVTWRKDAPNVALSHVYPKSDIIELNPNAPENKADVREFLLKTTERPRIKSYMHGQAIGIQEYMDELWRRSEGNFMYLRSVINSIERGHYRKQKLDTLPIGLEEFYEDHWNRMKQDDERFGEKVEVLAAFMEFDAISLSQIANFGIDPVVAQDALVKWGEFLRIEHRRFGAVAEECYQFYHATFHEFLMQQREVKAASLRLKLRAIEFFESGSGEIS